MKDKEVLLKNNVDKILKHYRSAILLYENDDIEASLLVINRILSMITFLLADLRNYKPDTERFVNYFIHSRRSQWSEDMKKIKKLSDWKNHGNWDIDWRWFEDFIGQLDFILRRIRQEINEVFGIHPWYVKVYYKNILPMVKSLKIILTLTFIVCFLIISKCLQYSRYGLKAEYFTNAEFEGKPFVKKDKKIDFNWENKYPIQEISADPFSVRWSGKLIVRKEAIYIFSTIVDDGVRLYIDDKIIIDQWKNNWNEHYESSLFLTRGIHKIKLEYFDQGGAARIQLFWRKDTEPEKIIPSNRFLPN